MRFILTMWYVNSSNTVREAFAVSCFILTMWYVNGAETSDVTAIKSCFILTMWYVNSLIEVGLGQENGRFYINYVVCKLNFY